MHQKDEVGNQRKVKMGTYHTQNPLPTNPPSKLLIMQNIPRLTNPIIRENRISIPIKMPHIHSAFGSNVFSRTTRDPHDPYRSRIGLLRGLYQYRGKEFSKQEGGEVISPNLKVVALSGFTSWGGVHYSGVVEEDVKTGFGG